MSCVVALIVVANSAHRAAAEERRARNRKDEFPILAVREALAAYKDMSNSDTAARLVREHGVGPFLKDPRSRVRDEIQAVCDEFGWPHDAAHFEMAIAHLEDRLRDRVADRQTNGRGQ